jgi:hypothetical protein
MLLKVLLLLLLAFTQTSCKTQGENDQLRIMYIVSSSSGTNKDGSDRVKKTIMPVLETTIRSMLSIGYAVDLYLILSYELSEDREQLIRAGLPTSVGLEVWNSATPFFVPENNKKYIRQIPKALARQHRFVVRDKLFFYDMFVVVEDDMLVQGEQIQYHLQMTAKIENVKNLSPESLDASTAIDLFYGNLTKRQAAHLWPGFLRTEVLQEGSVSQEKLDEIPVDNESPLLNASLCCRMLNKPDPSAESLMVWETGIAGLSVREVPGLGWVVFLQGPTTDFLKRLTDPVAASYFPYDVYNLTRRPLIYPHKHLYGQTGGWMATRKQLLDLHLNLCEGGFFPPFDTPNFYNDGLFGFNSGVEYWSGGLQMWTKRNGCNMQRVVPLRNFSAALVYHTANNKQLAVKEHRRVLATNLVGQLNTLIKTAKRAKARKLLQATTV